MKMIGDSMRATLDAVRTRKDPLKSSCADHLGQPVPLLGGGDGNS